MANRKEATSVVPMLVRVPTELHKMLKNKAFYDGTTMSAIIIGAVKKEFDIKEEE